MSTPDTRGLQQTLAKTLNSLERKRKLMSYSHRLIFLMALGWFVYIGVTNYLTIKNGAQIENVGTETEPVYEYQDTTASIVKVFFIGGGVYWILLLIFQKSYAGFYKQEWDVMTNIVHTLFPQAEFSRTKYMPSQSIIFKSKFFTGLSRNKDLLVPQLFASLKVKSEENDLYITDLGITKAMNDNGLEAVQAYSKLFSLFGRVIFGNRSENAMLNFRGMFAWIEYQEKFKGHLVVLPDHLESKLGYLAKSIQKLKDVEGNKLVTLEDPEFEKYFAVYTSDEIFARNILTPAMMRDMTRLREKYGRDIMLSFSGKRFYFAVNMPDGFLNLRAGAVNANDRMVEEIYNDIQTVSSISQELNLEHRKRFVTV